MFEAMLKKIITVNVELRAYPLKICIDPFTLFTLFTLTCQGDSQ